MRFIKKDIDKRLLILVIVLLILITSLIIYYEAAFHKLSANYNKNRKIFGDLTADAIIEEFNKTSNIKENILNYKSYLEKKYNELDTLNKNLRSQAESLKAELSLIKSQMEYQKAKEAGPTEQFRLFQSKNDEISRLNGKIKELCSKLEDYNISDSNCFVTN